MNNPLRSLSGRIILLVFLATVVSATTVSWISVQSLSSFLHQKVDQRFPRAASRISRELDQWYVLRTRELEVFASSTILTESAPQLGTRSRHAERARDETEQYLRYVLDSFPQFERLILVNSDGRSLVEVGDGKPLPDRLLSASTPHQETNSISDAMRIDGHFVQIASTPMRNANGRSIGRLFALMDLKFLLPALQSREIGETASVFIVDRNMRFLNPPAGLDPDTRFVAPEAGSNRGTPSVLGVAHYDNVQDFPVVGTQVAFPRFGWTLVLEQSYEEALAPVASSIGRVAGLNLAIVLIVSLAASRLAGSFVKPLRELSDAAERLSKGERGVEIDETSLTSEEVNVLTRTFNEMSRGLERNAREIEKSHQAVKVANDELIVKNQELSDVNLVLEQLSITDGLTKLHNHRYFQESIVTECKRSLRSKDPLSLILIDIDYFKKWNDRLGHAGGDEILRRLAKVLNQCVRETDILTRYGGEEFALIALDTDLDGVIALAEKIRQSVEEEQFLTDVPSEKEQLTISIGVATLYEDRKQLFADADAALYTAKDTGRNRVVAADPRPR
jgi:diguanylate cyclase (GGDEF)-like protein